MQKILRSAYWLIQPLIDPIRLVRNLTAYPSYLADIFRYRRLPGAEASNEWSLRPILDDKTQTSGFDAHYVYLGAWAFRHIAARRPARHVDVGSQIGWVACVAGLVETEFIDIRPFTGTVAGLSSRGGSVLAMPYPDRVLESLSCLHVVEHIGLGRYGDPLNPAGTRAAVRELARVIAPGGSLYFGTPVGRTQVVFNAHRVLSAVELVALFAEAGLELREFAAVDDAGRFHPRAEPRDFGGANYACGMFHLVRA